MEEKKKKQLNNNKNPLAPLKKQILDYSKVSEDIRANDYSIDRVNKIIN